MKLYQVSRVLVFTDETIHRTPIRTFASHDEAQKFARLSQSTLEQIVLSTIMDDAHALAVPAQRLVASLGIKQVHTVVTPLEVEQAEEPKLIHVPRLVGSRH